MTDPEPTEKRCCTCKQTKPLDDFCRNRTQPDGKASWCRACAREWRLNNKDKKRVYAARYRAKPEAKEKARQQARERNRRPEIREKRRAELRRRRQRLLLKHPHIGILAEAKSGPCVDCGNHYPPEIMEMDHVRGEKRFSVNQTNAMKISLSTEDWEAEIAKCELRCPTCHRLRHFLERSQGRPMLV